MSTKKYFTSLLYTLFFSAKNKIKSTNNIETIKYKLNGDIIQNCNYNSLPIPNHKLYIRMSK